MSSATPPGGRTATPDAPPAIPPVVMRLPRAHEKKMDRVVARAMRRGDMSGAVVIVVRHGAVVFRKAYGHAQVVPERLAMQPDALFDLASLTKPMVTATLITRLARRGALDVKDTVAKHLPAFAARGKAKITIEQLLTHTGGLPAANALRDYRGGRKLAISNIMDASLAHKVGERVYSDVGYIVLGELIAKVTGKPLDEVAKSAIFAPIDMDETGYAPGAALRQRAVPTEQRDGRMLKGTVHDPRAHLLDGVAGHAGLFSTADDVAKFMMMLLDHPEHAALGYKPYLRGYGHTGFTGTSLWLDRSSRAAWRS